MPTTPRDRVRPQFATIRSALIHILAGRGIPTVEIADELGVNRSYVIRLTEFGMKPVGAAEKAIAKLAAKEATALARLGMGFAVKEGFETTLAGDDGKRGHGGGRPKKDAPKAKTRSTRSVTPGEKVHSGGKKATKKAVAKPAAKSAAPKPKAAKAKPSATPKVPKSVKGTPAPAKAKAKPATKTASAPKAARKASAKKPKAETPSVKESFGPPDPSAVLNAAVGGGSTEG